MNILKFGHSCLLVEEKGTRILIDPGMYSTNQNTARNIDIILVTHDHQDHLDIESLRQVLKNNPRAQILTNIEVGKKLDELGVMYELLEHGGSTSVKGVPIEGFGKEHALIHRSIPLAMNTGYFIAGRFFHPGDALYKPKTEVEILALPVAGQWLTIGQSVDYALEVKPGKSFPIHDGMLKQPGMAHRLPGMLLPPQHIQFVVPWPDKPLLF